MVCHSTSRIADISDKATVSPTGVAGVGVHYNANYEKPFIFVDNLVVSNVGGLPKVSFTVRRTLDNAAVKSIVAGYPRFIIADLVPAGTATAQGTWLTPMFEQWASENATAAGTTPATPGGVWDNSGAASGNYAYTFAKGFDNAANPSLEPEPGEEVLIEAPDFDNTHIQRILVRISGGTPVNNVVGTTTSNAVGVVDFNIPAVGASTPGLGYVARQFVTVEACQKCHGPNVQGMAHGGTGNGYVDTRACVLCHTPIGSFADTERNSDNVAYMLQNGGQAWLASLVHKIHKAIAMPIFPTRLGGVGYGGTTYPQDVRDCDTCHTNSGKNLGAGDNTANWKEHPTANVCGTCHVGFPATSHKSTYKVVTGTPVHPGGEDVNSNCSLCHPAAGTPQGVIYPVSAVHNTSPDNTSFNANPKNVPEFNVTLTLDPVKAFYAAGDNVTVKATLTKHSDNTAVPSSVYTSPKDNAAITGGGLFSASLYFYGPRALPKPILKAQSTPLFVSTTDNNVATDNTAFKYKVKIPAGLTSGTYGVRVRFGDYGRVNDNNYVVESIAFKTVQVGTATVEKKVAGDACVDCHGNGSAPFHDARHIVVWDTDECNACHDYSGGHADVLNNRVHAVHSASKTGDAVSNPPIDWSDVTYPLGVGWPGGIGRCAICHTSGNTSYRVNVKQITCYGCHADRPGAVDHMVQNGGEDFSPVITP